MQKFLKVIVPILLIIAMAIGMAGCDTVPVSSNTETGTMNDQPAVNTKPINVVWYPNESSGDYESSRKEFGRLIEEATGRKVEHKLTTDYTIAIEALASGASDISAVMGAVGYIEAKNKNPQLDVLFVNSGASGTLDDAIYYSWICVDNAVADDYKDGVNYSIKNIEGKKMSFVSNSSTSGFKVPTTAIIKFFKDKNLTTDDLIEGGPKAFFSEVLFGQSHQGSAFNLFSGKADVAAFNDTETIHYIDLIKGEEYKVGAVYAVKQNASAPFDKVGGKEFVIIESLPVLNAPFAYNPKNLSTEDIQKIRDIFTSDAAANNENFFFIPDSGNIGLFKKTGEERFVLVKDSWYDPLR